MVGKRAGILVIASAWMLFACSSSRYKWAFAQNLDNSFHPNETCRESLAQSVYAPANQGKTVQQGGSNIFLFNGSIESYRIYAYKNQDECERALTGMLARQRISR
jgi:hypothetical protein